MATALAPDAKGEEWTESTAIPVAKSKLATAEWLWTLFGLVLLGAFLLLVVEDFPLRALIVGN